MFLIAALILATLPIPVLAQAAASASPSPAAPAPPAWHNPTGTQYSIFDPCGGPKEILNKIDPSPCVLVAGQSEASFGYTTLTTNGNVAIGGRKFNFDLPIAGNANVYPNLLLTFGVTQASQLSFTLPSDVGIGTMRLGGAMATTNPSFDYKQLVYFSPKAFTLAAVDLGYMAPTSNGFPSYQLQPQLSQPLGANWSAGMWWTFLNSTTPTLKQGTERSWSDPFGFYLVWSPAQGGFAFLPIVEHQFNPNRTTVVADVAQILSRRVLINLAYGGLGVSATGNGGFAHTLTFSSNANPRFFGATLYFMTGALSNLPPQPPAPSPAPTAQ